MTTLSRISTLLSVTLLAAILFVLYATHWLGQKAPASETWIRNTVNQLSRSTNLPAIAESIIAEARTGTGGSRKVIQNTVRQLTGWPNIIVNVHTNADPINVTVYAIADIHPLSGVCFFAGEKPIPRVNGQKNFILTNVFVYHQ
jgi:hypothetical protein